jgi:hypothetical protein
VSNSTMSQLQKEIDDLRVLVMQLSHIVLSRVFEKAELPNFQKSDAPQTYHGQVTASSASLIFATA